ncbi:MAG: hypothetical protein E7547_02790 [Ruminococcaceae bacterium]|nr:hypothetical protein [Oscillospiraceae bacterium]
MKCVASDKSLTERIRKEERDNAVKAIMVNLALAACDKCRLSKKTAEKLVKETIYGVETHNRGEVTLAEKEQVFEEEYGIRFHWG